MNFAISHGRGEPGIHHLGIQVENQGELAEVYERLEHADAPVLEEGATTCCYAKSEKSWIEDPQGLAWETFLTFGESTVYGGDGPAMGSIPVERKLQGVADGCCTPEIPANPTPAKASSCCGPTQTV